MVGRPSKVFTRIAFVEKTLNRKSTNVCIAIVGTNQLYPYSLSPQMPTRRYTGHGIDTDLQKVKPKVWLRTV